MIAIVLLVGSMPTGAQGSPDLGACCLDFRTCRIDTKSDCEADGGLYLGDGTNCGQVDCECAESLDTCDGDLGTCEGELAACEVELEGCQVFPGDGAGSGPPLAYTDHGHGRVTDENTGFMWEQKVAGGGSCLTTLHAVSAVCNWYHATGDWIDRLNNRCNADTILDCTTGGDSDCVGVAGPCGFAGYRDWRLRT